MGDAVSMNAAATPMLSSRPAAGEVSGPGINRVPFASAEPIRHLIVFVIFTLAIALLQQYVGAESSVAGLASINVSAVVLGLIWVAVSAIVGFVRPRTLVYAMGFFTWFTAWKPIDLTIGSFQTSQILAALAALMLALRFPLGKALAGRLAKWVILFVCLVTIWTIGSLWISPGQMQGTAILRAGRSLPFVRSVTGAGAVWIAACGFWCVVMAVRNEKQLRTMIGSWTAGAVMTAAVGFWLFLRESVLALPRFTSPLLGDFGGGVHLRDATIGGDQSRLIVRISAFANEPRHLTYLLAPLLTYWVILSTPFGENRVRHWPRRLALLVTLFAAFAFTASRSTYIVTAVIPMALLFSCWRQLIGSSRSLWIATCVVVLGIAFIAGSLAAVSQESPVDFVATQLQSLADTENASSGVPIGVAGLRIAWHMFTGAPIVGRGWGTYVYFMHTFADTQLAESPVPNNLYALMLSETGIIGFLVTIGLLFASLEGLGGDKQSRAAARVRALRGAVLMTWICFVLWDTIQYTHLWMVIGLLSRARTFSMAMATSS